MRDILTAGLTALGLDTAAAPQLERYAALLLEKNKVMNLTAITDERDVATLHLLDCAALLAQADMRGKTVIDVGTGAGFPGMVLAILEPSVRFTLLDSLGKRVDFLREVCEQLGLKNVTCVHARAEEFAAGHRERFDIATSRAVAQLKEEYPHITVSVISGSPMQVDNWLRDGSVEIGVTDRRWTGAELDWTKLVDDPFLAVLPPDSDAPDPMPAAYLSGKAVIIPDYGTNTDTTRVFTRAGVEPAYTDDRLNNRSVLAAVAAGLGSTVFSRLELDYYAQQNLTVRAIDPPCLRELGVAMRPAVKNNPVARSLLRALRRAAADDIA